MMDYLEVATGAEEEESIQLSKARRKFVFACFGARSAEKMLVLHA